MHKLFDLNLISKTAFPLIILLLLANLASAQQPTAPKLRPIQKDGKWGYIDQTGKIAIKPQFYWAEEFSEGMAAFESDEGLYGYIDESGKVVIEPKLERWSPFSEGLAAAAIKNMEWGYIDKAGTWVIKPQFHYAQPFKDGYAAVDLLPEKNGKRVMGEDESTIIDRTGKVMFKPVPYVLNSRTSKGVVFFQSVHKSPVGGDDAKSLLLDKTGKVIFEGENLELDGFSDGLAAVKSGGKWGYVNEQGRFAIKPRYEEAKVFSEGLAAVKIGEKWGFIDPAGTFVIPAKYSINEIEDDDHIFSEGLAMVYLGEDIVFIDRAGKVALKPDFTEVGRFIGGLAAFTNTFDDNDDEERGYINKKGKIVWGPTLFRYKSTSDLREQTIKREEKEGTGEKLNPLTDEEKKIDYRKLVAGQPDFTAVLTYFRSHYVSGSGFAYKLARKGNRFRKESQFWTFIGETGKSKARLNSDKTYNDMEGVDDESAGTGSDFNPKLLALDPTSEFIPLGKITIDGHECIKIAVKRKEAAILEEELYLYAAKDLNNLIIVAQLLNANATLVQRLENISLDVPDSLVQIPADYKPVERDVWKKVENARVKFGGKDAKNFGVFRAPGGELIVWINDSGWPPEYYLVRPKEAVAEIVFLGLVVSRDGKQIWQSKDSEAQSETYYRSPGYIKERKKDASPVMVNEGSLSFPSRVRRDLRIEVTLPQ